TRARMNRNLATLSAALVLPIHPAPPPGSAGPEGAPIPKAAPLAAAASPKLGKSVDGIKCESHEQVLFHIHAHLTIFVKGKARQVPYGIGIGSPFVAQPTRNGPFVTSGDCFSWLHTH